MCGISRVRKSIIGRTTCLIVAMLFGCLAASAQLEVGDYVKMNLTGNLGYGYTGAFGNGGLPSSHSQGMVADANLTGYYFHPNFLSFSFRPYFDRSQANSDSQTLTRSTGFGGEVNLFGGSRMPGSVSFSKDFSSNSEFRIAGVPSIVGDTSSQNFGIAWSALFPNYPTLRASYTMGSSSSSVTGLPGDSESDSKNLTLNSEYKLAGFNLQGRFNHLNNHFTTPAFVTEVPLSNGGSSTSYGVSAQHRLPLGGSMGLGWGHSDYRAEDGSDWSTSSYSAGVGFTPWQRLSISQSLNYTTNLSGIIAQTLGAGTVQQPLRFSNGSDGLYLNTNATLRIFNRLSVTGYFNHREQSYSGGDFSDSLYGGTVNYNYSSPLFGFLYVGIGVVNTANKQGNQSLGFVGNLAMNKKFGKWDTSADFNYAQNVQTLIGVQTMSTYSYGGSVRRRINHDTFWTTGFRGARSGLVVQEGSGNRSESYSAAFSWRRYGFSGVYSQSTGTAVLTSSGALTAAPLGPLITSDFLFFNARSYSVNASTVLFRRATLTGGYANVFSDSKQGLLATTNSGERYNARIEYRLRKFSIIGGFNRNMQDISAVAGPPRVVNSYFLSLTRWFNVF